MLDRESKEIISNWSIVLVLCAIMVYVLRSCIPDAYTATQSVPPSPKVIVQSVVVPPLFMVNSNFSGPCYPIGLGWNASQTTGVTYNVYFGSTSLTYTNITPVGSATNVGVLCEFGHPLFFSLTAENSIGIESFASSEVWYHGRYLPDRITVNWSTSPPCALLISTDCKSPRSTWTVAQAKPSSGTITVLIGTGSLFFSLQGSTNKLSIRPWNPLNT